MKKKNQILNSLIGKRYKYDLLENGFSNEDISIGKKVLNSKRITMASYTRKFELVFARKLGAKYALMVNSGSSANLLATFAAGNPLKKNHLNRGDEVLIPALCWSTSIWPLVQFGLKPVLVDIDIQTLNINIEDLIKKITKKTKAIMLINVLGISSDLFKIKKIANKYKLIIIEDNCESLGSRLKNKYLGTFGDYGSYSFYYSHQITSGEGGMITCNKKEDYDILFALRSHGWLGGTRHYKRSLKSYNQYAKQNPQLDPRYIFINSGFNLRPTDIQAAIAHNQFNRLDKLKKFRNINRNLLINKITKSKKWNNQFQFISIPKDIDPSWMGLPILLSNRFKNKKKKFMTILDKMGIETRPIISGNFANQPAAKLYNLCKKNEKFENSQKVQDLGFLIGLHTRKISKSNLKLIHDAFFMIDQI
ncbi:aminotransferase class I/II-fold pyridoxal phosphate-dependent enzyme [Candidatus Pelagibacter ubique]|nr:aminotransferase class I/II-fold pyridoxal phosphate-dependent enzyme [Candidatus Pelagibacter ubique]MDC0618157.1 aminotransferase class I/II-fold pyridoxal phosphate-dependent enzyme [Candidatus Pelagibacter sp.]